MRCTEVADQAFPDGTFFGRDIGDRGRSATNMRLDAINNPYEPPVESQTQLDLTRRGLTLIPKQLADQTRRVVNRFGLFQFAWPMIAAYWTDSLAIDFIALFIATNSLRIQRSSFKRFPWTALMCSLYPIAFVVSIQRYDAFLLANWIPTRDSPVLALQLVSSCWAIYAMVMIVRCHTSHWRRKAEPNDATERRSRAF